MQRSAFPARPIFPLLVVAVLSACNDASQAVGVEPQARRRTPTPAPVTATVAVTPAAASLAVGGTVQLTATLRDASGNAITGRTVTWSSASSAIATVSATGLVTAMAAGGTSISASAD